jgi:N-acetyl-anhydromuramyl-L-alanine amidase AmpD
MRVDLVVIHTMENQEKPGSAMQVAQWFASKGSPRASAHYCVDRDQVVRTVREHDIAWHAPGANHNGIGVEHAGFARQSAAEWADEYSTTMLHRSARLVAGICSRWGIPAVRVTADELKRGGARGICGHLDCTQAFSDGKGHWDPGGFFPWVEYLEWVRAALDGGR